MCGLLQYLFAVISDCNGKLDSIIHNRNFAEQRIVDLREKAGVSLLLLLGQCDLT